MALAAGTKFLNGWLIGTAFFLFIFLAFLSGLVRAIQSRSWPRTPAKVVESSVRQNAGASSSDTSSPSHTYEPIVRYTYVIDGKAHESKQIAIGVVSGSAAGAESIAARYPLGATVTVHHHPTLHYLAVLEPGRWVLPLLATLLSGAVLYAVAAVWVSRSLHPREGPWDKAGAKSAAAKAALVNPQHLSGESLRSSTVSDRV